MNIAQMKSRLKCNLGNLSTIVLILLSLGCSASQESGNVVMNTAPGIVGPEAFSLELEQVFGGDEDSPELMSLLGNIGSVALHRSGVVYIVDTQSNHIVAFDADGSFKWRKGVPGQGPGELMRPNHLVATSDGLILMNQGGSRIDRFDLDGEYQSVLPNSNRFSPKCMISNNRLLGQEPIQGEWRLHVQSTISEYNLDSLSVLIDASFDIDQPTEFGAGMAVIACSGPEISIAGPGAYLINRYSLDGAYLGSFGRTDTGWKPPITVTGQGTVTLPPFLPSIPLRVEGMGYFVVAQWFDSERATEIANAMLTGIQVPARNWQYSLDLFDEKGALISTLSGDGESPIGRPLTSDQTGAIYTYVNAPIPQVRKYRIVLD